MSVNINNFVEPNKVNVTNTSNKITLVDLSKKENTVVTPSPKTTKVVTVVTAAECDFIIVSTIWTYKLHSFIKHQ